MPPLSVLLFVVALAALLPFSLHLLVLMFLDWRRRRQRLVSATPVGGEWPWVAVQLPLYNEPQVAARLLEAVANLDYPCERFEIQVLDDSTDKTTEIVAEAVRQLRARGLSVSHLHRRTRDGFKAGALAAGLAATGSELLAIFDADFVPPRDFLKRTVPHFADSGVAAVQTRWGYLNREASSISIAQAFMVDLYFEVQQPVRAWMDVFVQFNGSGGIWRRRAIEEAGGWTHDTLLEDLDLSFRAQLQRWRIVYEPDVICGSELTASIAAFRSQQRRWAAGMIQVAVKHTGALLRAPLPLWTKILGLMHLIFTPALAAVLVLALLLLSAPPFGVHTFLASAPTWATVAIVLSLPGPGPFAAALYGQAVQAPRRWRHWLGQFPTVAAISIGISWEATLGVVGALVGAEREFVRTPKVGGGAHHARPTCQPFPWSGAVEIGLAAYCAWAAWWHLRHGLIAIVPALCLGALAFAGVGMLSLVEFAAPRLLARPPAKGPAQCAP
jgi:cellulose synthase/poly-beta-1,6-N-acetylglucosamine synthase-like glycosyltransferase